MNMRRRIGFVVILLMGLRVLASCVEEQGADLDLVGHWDLRGVEIRDGKGNAVEDEGLAKLLAFPAALEFLEGHTLRVYVQPPSGDLVESGGGYEYRVASQQLILERKGDEAVVLGVLDIPDASMHLDLESVQAEALLSYLLGQIPEPERQCEDGNKPCYARQVARAQARLNRKKLHVRRVYVRRPPLEGGE